jgi:predicted  nucleic acid-binding Zn-ribbon protein
MNWETIGGFIGITILLISIMTFTRTSWIRRLDNLEKEVDRKMDEKTCNPRYEAVKERLDRGEEHFSTIMKQISEMKELLGRVDERLDSITQKRKPRRDT